MPGYEYIERRPAPRIAEFYARTPQGHRVVRIHLDGYDIRVIAFNETNSSRSPATLFMEELLELVQRAKTICKYQD